MRRDIFTNSAIGFRTKVYRNPLAGITSAPYLCSRGRQAVLGTYIRAVMGPFFCGHTKILSQRDYQEIEEHNRDIVLPSGTSSRQSMR